MIQHKDQTSRTMGEFKNEIDPKLRAVLLELDHFTVAQFGTNLTITCLIRTHEEQMIINPNRPNSSHCSARAADLRSSVFIDGEIATIHDHIRQTWGDMVHFKHHDSGSGDHFHLNINRAYATRKET